MRAINDDIAIAVPDPNGPEFVHIRGELARLYIEHRAGLGLVAESDEWIARNVVVISATLFHLSLHAREHGDRAWLARHEWWLAACRRLYDGEHATASTRRRSTGDLAGSLPRARLFKDGWQAPVANI